MKGTTRIVTLSWIFMFFCLASLSSASSDEERIDLNIKGRIMSAELEGVPLRLILEKLKREKGIWYRGSEPELGEKRVSIRFKDLPLEEGLRRILSGMDHVLLFDQEKGLVGLVILGKKESGRIIPRDEPRAIHRGLPSEPFENATVSRNPFEILSNPFELSTREKESPGTTMGEHLPSSEDPYTEITEETSTEPFRSIENPFIRRNPFTQETAPSPENPFQGDVSPSRENPFTQEISPSPESPFQGNVPPSPENPFLNLNPFAAPQ